MGLDQYLNAKIRMGKYSNAKLEDKENAVREIFPEIFKTGNLDTLGIEFEAGYWRKANQIHKWFVDNCQGGEDDCRTSYIDREQLKQLLEDCKKVLASIKKPNAYKKITKLSFTPDNSLKKEVTLVVDEKTARNILPTTTGFFFGSQSYDELYIQDIEMTIKIINKCLALPKDWEFYYSASW